MSMIAYRTGHGRPLSTAAQPEDTVLVCGFVHTVAHVMEDRRGSKSVAQVSESFSRHDCVVALGVIVGLWSAGRTEKHYQDEFAAIPLVPKPATAMPDMMPAATQALPTQPPEGAVVEEVRAGDAACRLWTRRAWRLTMSSLIRYRWRRLNRSRLKSQPQPKTATAGCRCFHADASLRNQSPTINLRRPAKPMSYSWAR